MYICNEGYLKKTQEVTSRIWNFLPAYFMNMRKENAAQTNALEHFLMHGKLEFGSVDDGFYVPHADFCRHFIAHCREHEIPNRKSLKKDYYAGPFSKRNMTMTRCVKVDLTTQEERSGNWIEGVKIST
jgi:hypothetical protein